GLNSGGGKTVIIGDPQKDKNTEMFRALGRYIQSLNGRYITAEDVGTTVQDMYYIHMETDYIAGTSPGNCSAGNHLPVTAYGIYKGIKSTAKVAFGDGYLNGKKIAIQGVGNVAYHLCRYLHKEGAELIITDINKEALKQAKEDFGATVVEPEDIYAVNC